MEARRPSQSSSPNSFAHTLTKVVSPPAAVPPSPDPSLVSRQRVKAHAAELRAKKQDPTYKDVPVSEERPMSNYKDVLNRLDALSTSSSSAPPIPKIPGGLSARLSRRMPKVTISSPTKSKDKSKTKTKPAVSPSASVTSLQTTSKDIVPDSPSRGGRFSSLRGMVGRPSTSSNENKNKSSRPTTPLRYSHENHEKEPVLPDSLPTAVPTGQQVRDPVDVAVDKLVAMGFDEVKAKKALAQSDSGNSIDFDKALSKLVKDKERAKRLERLNKMG